MSDRYVPGRALAVACTAGLVATVVALGVSTPPVPTPVGTDRLGPGAGEPVAHYLTRAAATVAPAGEDTRWGLVGFDTEVTATRAGEAVGPDVALSQLWFRVPLERVQTALVPVGVSGTDSLSRAAGYAAARLQRAGAGGDDRRSRIDEVSAARLGQDCACVVAATVRGPQSALAALAAVPGVRVVEALPADAVYGRFAVRPLLPGQRAVVAPGPDDGAVPAR